MPSISQSSSCSPSPNMIVLLLLSQLKQDSFTSVPSFFLRLHGVGSEPWNGKSIEEVCIVQQLWLSFRRSGCYIRLKIARVARGRIVNFVEYSGKPDVVVQTTNELILDFLPCNALQTGYEVFFTKVVHSCVDLEPIIARYITLIDLVGCVGELVHVADECSTAVWSSSWRVMTLSTLSCQQ